jgi:hypothetical protein
MRVEGAAHVVLGPDLLGRRAAQLFEKPQDRVKAASTCRQ